jgi:hypothetical protein
MTKSIETRSQSLPSRAGNSTRTKPSLLGTSTSLKYMPTNSIVQEDQQLSELISEAYGMRMTQEL